MSDYPNDIQIADRRRQIASLMLAGARQADCARALRLDEPTVSRDVVAIRKQWREEQTADYQDWVAAEIARLDRLQMTHWDSATRGSHQATEAVLKIIDRRIKLLGLDAPERHKVEVTQGTALEVVSARLAALAASFPVEEEGKEDPEGETAT
jgi:sigma54-dependent transcription regulator